MWLADLRPGRAPRPWTEGDADEAGLATEVEVCGATAGAAWGSGTAGSMSETMRGGESGDGDAVADADADADAEAEAEAGLLLEAGAWLLSWVVSVVLVLMLVGLSTSPSAVASPVVATEDGAGTVAGGSSTSAEAITLLSVLAAGSIGGGFEARKQRLARRASQRRLFPSDEVSGLAQAGFESQQTVGFVRPVSAWPTPEAWFLSWSAKSAKSRAAGQL